MGSSTMYVPGDRFTMAKLPMPRVEHCCAASWREAVSLALKTSSTEAAAMWMARIMNGTSPLKR
jgi:hypothetical protein